MYVKTMSAEQIIDQYKSDCDLIESRCTNYYNMDRRQLLKTKTFPCNIYHRTKTPNGNEAIVVMRYTKNFNKKGGCRYSIYGLMNTDEGTYIIDGANALSGNYAYYKGQYRDAFLVMYTPHIVRRYIERLGISSKREDSFGIFLSQLSEIPTVESMSDNKHGFDTDIIGIVPNGLFYGTIDGRVLTYRTFLPTEKLNKGQMQIAQDAARYALENLDEMKSRAYGRSEFNVISPFK